MKPYWENAKSKRLTWINPNPLGSAAPLNLQNLEAHNRAIDDKVDEALMLKERAHMNVSPSNISSNQRSTSPLAHTFGLPPPPPPPPPEDDDQRYTGSIISSAQGEALRGRRVLKFS